MVKKNKKNVAEQSLPYLYVIGTLLVLFFVYFWFAKGLDVFKVTVYDENEEEIVSQSAGLNQGSDFLQSVFEYVPKLHSFLMQSSVPLEKNAKTAIFKTAVDNPFNADAEVHSVTIYKNEDVLDVRGFGDLILPAGETFVFTSEPLSVEGKESQKNVMRLEFLFRAEGEEKLVDYVYEYLYLTRCNSDADCPPLAPKCDKANAARFSTGRGVFYCVRPCGAHMDCAPGQICIHGACGY